MQTMEDQRVPSRDGVGGSPPRTTRAARVLGVFMRLLWWLLMLATFIVSLWLGAAAVLAFSEGYTQDALFIGAVAITGFWLVARIRKWGRI